MTLSDFLLRLEKSKLLAVRQLADINGLLAQYKEPGALADRLVEDGIITRFQASELLAGRYAFFIGEYKLLELLGTGSMGTVFKVIHTRLNRIAALKLMTPTVDNPTAVERFKREIRGIASLSHPNVVASLGADCIGKHLYLVMEYLEGQTLKEWIRGGEKIPIHLACDCIRQGALALQHAHERGLLHRDVKPANFVVTWPTKGGPPLVKVLDLGLALFITENQSRRLTSPGEILGTPDYIAPEQARNVKEADARCDVYSLGCTFFETLTAQLPFAGKNMVEKLMARMHTDPPNVKTLRAEVPDAIATLVAKMLARDPKERIQTAREVAERLAPFVGG